MKQVRNYHANYLATETREELIDSHMEMLALAQTSNSYQDKEGSNNNHENSFNNNNANAMMQNSIQHQITITKIHLTIIMQIQ